MLTAILILYVGSFALGQRYEGCFKSSTLDPDLPSLILSRASSPSECVKECRSRYFMFAGLMNGQQCYCGNKFGRNGWSNACTLPCATDPQNYCGSHEAISIYATGQKGPSPPRRMQIKRYNSDGLEITWEPPDMPNGNVTSYTLRAVAIDTYATDPLPPVESQVQGGASNTTILRGLQPGTKYNITLTATNTQGTSDPIHGFEWTLIGPPNKPAVPKILDHGYNTIIVKLPEGSSECGPISAYQVLVVQPGTIPPTGENISYPNFDSSVQQGLGYYVTGEFAASDFNHFSKFTVGNGKLIGGYYNTPLEHQSIMPRVGLAVVSRLHREVRYAYSDLTNDLRHRDTGEQTNRMDITAIALCIAITLLGALLVASILVYFILRQRHEKFRMRKLPEQQELTLQGPVYEVDNMAYIPEDVPERVNHYQELKSKVWSVPRSALTIDNAAIRRGRFGTVHMGTVEKDGQFLGVTVHSIADGLLRGSEKRHMLRELDVCIRASAMEYLAGLVGTCETSDTLYVVLELPPQTLKSRLLAARSGDIFPVDRILPIASCIAAALQHLENYKIVHDHLCARSVGLCEDWTPKLMGHGISKYALEDLKYARWTAVESFGNQKKHHAAVVWAFGVLLWEMLSMGGTPYSNLMLDSEVEEVVCQGIRLLQLPDTPDPLYEVMLSCWLIDPQERPTFAELTRLDTLSILPITAITEPYIPQLELNE
ncbi:hypothetical protein KM043_014574 [Ampulex compressa]|nr:hypothetical protein KM043_014574 [Ampulex compressa]